MMPFANSTARRGGLNPSDNNAFTSSPTARATAATAMLTTTPRTFNGKAGNKETSKSYLSQLAGHLFDFVLIQVCIFTCPLKDS